ncbi:hypothetical protein GF420_14210 [candidate division GN15 bacterium]|jgi:rubrerythrin|nr:hypothetical protein [candidate division GN15 bacterium]
MMMIDDMTLEKAVKLAIATEKAGADFYADLEKKFAYEDDLKNTFAQLVVDERAHEAQFKRLLEIVPKDEDKSGKEDDYAFLTATASSTFFQGDVLKQVDQIKDVTDALGTALAFEKSTLQYYTSIRDVLGDNEALNEIIEAERQHVLALMKVILADAKFRGVNYQW